MMAQANAPVRNVCLAIFKGFDTWFCLFPLLRRIDGPLPRESGPRIPEPE
jgi:hypothetical protein